MSRALEKVIIQINEAIVYDVVSLQVQMKYP